jgi:hypothetical protein
MLQNPNRRSFLWTLASLAPTLGAMGKAKDVSENVHRFSTPECDVRMSVEYFGKFLSKDFGFRDRLTNRGFCLSANGETDRNCLSQFSGSIAIAHYHFDSHSHSPVPMKMRERVLTIDQDIRMSTRPPFEGVLAVQQKVVSDIQAFGYKQNDPQATSPDDKSLWCLLRQDLYLNDQPAPFLIVHWKHTFDAINLVDVIPGDQTQRIS